MKKILTFLFLTIALVLPSCNDDESTENDGLYSRKLVGTWQNSNTYGDKSSAVSLILNAYGDFVYTSSEEDSKTLTKKMWTVPGAWNVQRGVLQLKYDVEDLRYSGLSDDEVQIIRMQLKNSNSVLTQSNKQGKTFGYGVSFEVMNGKEVLYLSGFNGYFQRLK
ncbi:MAG: hypothetical protein NC217_06560 [Muribaculaceae bacterium]|nr:hypothetical protein [Muribaculaceae bacterium]